MQVTRSATTTLEEVLENTPDGKIAMFRIDSMAAESRADDWILGHHVYVHSNKVWDFRTDKSFGAVKHFGLHFLGYISK